MLGIVCAMVPVVALVCVCYVVEVRGVGDGKTGRRWGRPRKFPGLSENEHARPLDLPAIRAEHEPEGGVAECGWVEYGRACRLIFVRVFGTGNWSVLG